MYSFEGDFRRKPQQNLAGASAQRKIDRDGLILQSQQQRQKREEHRKRLNSTIKIQAFVRSYLTRKHCKQNEREEFDSIFSRVSADNQMLLSSLVAKILFFYDDQKDCNRLVSISQLLLKQWQKVFQSRGSSIQIRRLLALHLRLLKDDSKVPLAVPLRMLEVFTSTQSAASSTSYEEAVNVIKGTFSYLIKRGYFKDLLNLMCQRTPPLYGPSPNPPTPFCGALFDLIQRPINLIMQINALEYEDTVMTEFTSTFLCNSYPESVEMFILPTLVHDSNKPFPFLSFVRCMRDENKFITGKLTNNSWLLHSVLFLEPPGLGKELRNTDNSRLLSNPIILDYLKLLSELTENICNKQVPFEYTDCLYDKDDDSDSEVEPNPTSVREQKLLTKCIEILNDMDSCVMMTCSQINEQEPNENFLEFITKICHNLLLSHKMALHKYRLLYTLAFKPVFVRGVWRWLSGMSQASTCGGPDTPLLAILSRGIAAPGVERLLAPLAVFCALFTLLIATLHDTEFFRDTGDDAKTNLYVAGTSGGRTHAFKFSELGGLCRALRQLCLGLLELAVPDTRPACTPYKHHQQPVDVPAWAHLFKVCTHLLRALYERDERLQFSAGAGAAWASERDHDAVEVATLVAFARARSQQSAPLVDAALVINSTEAGPPLTVKELRMLTVLRQIPFVMSFATRVLILQTLLIRERSANFFELSNFNEGPSINISVRRSHLYEDAFRKLSPENEPTLKITMRVQFINQVGADEAGIDGGGVFREFLSELLKSAFDPNRGLFRLTKDNMLYPNPGVNLLYDNFPMHYYFVGRMLGKALYESLLVELPLAEFFLSKLCSSREPDVHALASLDPALYRGLLLLREHRRQDVPDLGLDFTVVSDELGKQRIDELKPGGANIPVTAENRIEYIHLVADYKLNRQIRSQCNAFKRGLTSVVNTEWLRMFSSRELQLLISGAEVPIDIEDLKRNTHYTGGFTSTHPTVKCFWKVVEKFTDDQRRLLLKFVTSCSRPPLLGFKELIPSFCIQSSGSTDRLPTSSTCMNLLKLPEINSEQVLAEKLLYAIQAGAGFELS